MANTIDTLSIFNELKKVFSEEKAHKLSEVLIKVQEENLEALVTKKDLKIELKEMEMRLTIRMEIMLAASIAIIAALIKLL